LEVETDIQTLLGGLAGVDIKMPLQDVNGSVEEIYSLHTSLFVANVPSNFFIA